MATGDSETTPSGPNRRRWVLKTIGSLGVIGVAGCFGTVGDGEDTSLPPTLSDTGTSTHSSTVTFTHSDTGTSTHSRTGTMIGGTSSETRTQTEREELTQTTTDTSTPPVECSSLRSKPARLITFDGVYDGTLTVPTDAESITGTVTNPYLFEITNGEVTLEPPSDEWTIEPALGTTFESLASQASQEVEWEVSVPSTIGKTDDLLVHVAYETPTTNRCGADNADLTFTQPVSITQAALQ